MTVLDLVLIADGSGGNCSSGFGCCLSCRVGSSGSGWCCCSGYGSGDGGGGTMTSLLSVAWIQEALVIRCAPPYMVGRGTYRWQEVWGAFVVCQRWVAAQRC